MLHQNYGSWKIFCETGREAHNRRGTAGGRCEHDDGEALIRTGAGCCYARSGGFRVCGWLAGAGLQSGSEKRSGANHANFRGHANFAQQFFLDAVHVEVDRAGRFCNEFDCAEFQCLQGAGSPFARFRTDDDDRPRIRGHDLRGGLQAVHVRHVDVHGDDIGLERLRERDGFAAVFRLTDDLQLLVGVENRFEHLAHEGGVVDDEHTKLFVGDGCHIRLRHGND